jgi:uncharacterized protein (TIGR02246 family)
MERGAEHHASPDLARVLTDYEQAWRAKDAAALARLFAEDGFVLSPGTPMVRGRGAIEKAYRGEAVHCFSAPLRTQSMATPLHHRRI